MKVAVASGKGGTGKTTVAVALARLFAEDGPVQLIDCDVEEPNSNNLLELELSTSSDVRIPLPVVNEEGCTYCGVCARICRYNAIAVLKDRVMIFPELCNGCGACVISCPERVISEKDRRMGQISRGISNNLELIEGRLDLGQAKAVPVIDAAKEMISGEFTILDSPPGSSCPVMETARGCDIVILVSEPTRFGLHDLRAVVASLEYLNIPMLLVVNKVDSGEEDLESFASGKGIEIGARIPFDRKMAEVYSRGGDPLKEVKGFGESMAALKQKLMEIIGGVEK
jgi:MinD superfamily P-loop ATPase